MQIHEVNVLPTQETLDYLARVLSASTLTFKLDQLYLTLNVSTELPRTLDASAFYTAQPTDLHIWYDPAKESSELVLMFMSESLTDRTLALRRECPNPFHKSYYPHMVMIEYMPPIMRRYRAQINSYADTFLKDNFTFTFADEFVNSYESPSAPDMAFYAAMDMKVSQGLGLQNGLDAY